ncbi:MAG: putative Response regulator, CheY-like [Phycisphaerales bacterium]|nr:putative Response regulator, CheY-like [Phycisphaerales bacterium]
MATKSPRAAQGILIVEDDPIARDALVKVLTLLGYYTVSVATVAEGMVKLDGQHFAIIDMNLPDGVGTHILERIRAENRPIRVAIMSGSADEAIVEEAKRFAPELILSKPINLAAVLTWVEGTR